MATLHTSAHDLSSLGTVCHLVISTAYLNYLHNKVSFNFQIEEHKIYNVEIEDEIIYLKMENPKINYTNFD